MRSASAQIEAPTDTIWHVVTKDGNEFYGRILERSNEAFTLQTETIGVITLQYAGVRRMQPVDSQRLPQGVYWSALPHTTRYLFAPSGYGLRRGEGYYQNTWVMFNQANIGITDFASIGIGTIPLFFFDATPTPLWITPKLSLPLVENVLNVGLGGLVGTVIGSGEGIFGGLLNGVVTYGTRYNNVTLGGGFAFTNDDNAQHPLWNVSGIGRVGKRWYLLTENYAISNGRHTFGAVSVGGRYVGKGLSLDIALAKPFSTEGLGAFVLLPWLSATVPFRVVKND